MRSFILASLAAVALASSSSVTTSVPYSNPNTQFLTQTDSNGVITGQPTADTSVGAANSDVGTANTDVGSAATSIAALPPGNSVVNLVPAGEPTGINTVTIANTTLIASVGKNTTVVLVTSTSSSSSPASNTAATTTGSGSGSGSGSSSGSSSTSTGAAATMKIAGGALAGAAGLVAALL